MTGMRNIRKPVILTAAALLLLGYFIYRDINIAPHATWHMINVNAGNLQGDAHLITVGKKNILIDTGYNSEAAVNLLPYLQKLGIERIHHLFISHPHRDHYEGIAAIWDQVEIENLYVRIPPKHICDREIPWGCDFSHVQKFINDSRSRARGMTVHHPATGLHGNIRVVFDSNTGKIIAENHYACASGEVTKRPSAENGPVTFSG